MKGNLIKIVQTIIVMVGCYTSLYSQSVYNNSSSLRQNEPLKFPWAGGMNSIQFCYIDLDIDGIMDILAFDRRGNRKMCFINNGISGEISYEFSPQYSEFIPDFYEWVILADYNMDSRNDIFTYSPGYASVMVYKNVSDDVLKFELVVYPYLKTYLEGGYVNLYISSADYPGIADVDNDGDLDILTYGVNGSFIDMHKNMSIEKYGNPDSLDYKHTTYCWGRVAESDESNAIFLDTCIHEPQNSHISSLIKERHTGSTFLVHDLDGNGLVDLLLGDVDYPGLPALYNTGTLEDAFISYYDTLFPQGTNKVDLFSMPVTAYTDVNNDDKKDLLVSPFSPSLTTSSGKKSCWLYLNSGNDSNPIFELSQTNFLQSEMIDVGSGAYPVIYDWDGDGLHDLFIGNYGYYKYSYYENYILHSVYYSRIAYYKNIGTNQSPVLQLWDDNFAQLSSLHETGLIPAFDDIDGDGNPDLLAGNSEGKIIYVRYNKSSDAFEIIDQNYLNIDVGEYSAPQLFDLNKDGLNDLIIGEKGGNINYYQNTGTIGNPVFEYVTDSLGKINITDYSVSWDGYSVPSFFRDTDFNTGLVVGSEQGMIYYFTNIDNNLDGEFDESDQLNTLLDTNEVDFDRGMRTGAVICDLYSDGKLEMIAGNYSGGLEYFNGAVNVLSNINSQTQIDYVKIYPNPASNEIAVKFPESSGMVVISIFDTRGVEIVSYTSRIINNSVSINVSEIISGVYILSSKVGQKVFKNKFIILK